MRQMPILSPRQRTAILELGNRRSGGRFDPVVLSDLLNLGMLEIRSEDRRIALTKRGERVYVQLVRRDDAGNEMHRA